MKDLYIWADYYDNEQVHIGYRFGAKDEPAKGLMVTICSMHVDHLRDTFGVDQEDTYDLDTNARPIEMSLGFK